MTDNEKKLIQAKHRLEQAENATVKRNAQSETTDLL